MNRQSTTILIILVLLTFGGLILVSNFIGGRKSATETAIASVASSPKLLQTPASRISASSSRVPGELQNALEQLNSLSEAVKASDWTKAQGLFSAFELKDQRLPSPQLHHPDVSPILQDFFDLYVIQLERAITEKQPKQANVAINQLSAIIGEFQARFVKRALPVEVQRLHHLIREISLWKDSGDEKMLHVRKAALNEAWNDVAPLVRAKRNGDEIAPQFGALLLQLMAAENGTKLNALLSDLKTGLEQIDALFVRKGQGAGENGTAIPDEDE